MTSPRHAESTAKGRYYTHPVTGQRLVSVTNAISVGMAKPALVPWAAKVTAEHVMDHLPAIVAGCRTDRDATLREIKAQVTVARDKAADLGTRIHHQAEAHVTGASVPDDEEAAPFVGQYIAWLKAFDVALDRDVIAAETTVAYPELGYAGTLDLIVTLPIGYDRTTGKAYPLEKGQRVPWMVDLKSSMSRPADSIYPEYAMQLEALARCRELWLPDDTVAPVQRGVVGHAVLNLRRTTHALIPMPCGDPVWSAFRGALSIASWVHSDPTDAVRPVTAAGRSVPKPTRPRKVA